ncbi:MAG TPA: NfeD family protein, partial [Candidatus Limnocylindrales bacterium]
AFVLGASSLYTTPGNPTAPDVAVAAPLIATIAGLAAVFGGLIAFVAIRTRRMTSSPGLVGAIAGAVGSVGRVGIPLSPRGSVRAAGEEWSARTTDGRDLARGEEVRVVGQEGLTLVVEPLDAREPSPSNVSTDASAPPRPSSPQVLQ